MKTQQLTTKRFLVFMILLAFSMTLNAQEYPKSEKNTTTEASPKWEKYNTKNKISVDKINTNSVLIHWHGNAKMYDVTWTKVGENPNFDYGFTTENNYETITGLETKTQYMIYVRSRNSPAGVSEKADSIVITTL